MNTRPPFISTMLLCGFVQSAVCMNARRFKTAEIPAVNNESVITPTEEDQKMQCKVADIPCRKRLSDASCILQLGQPSLTKICGRENDIEARAPDTRSVPHFPEKLQPRYLPQLMSFPNSAY
ncbi:hypothetical protein ACOME3_000010 [Neoechinorhynchus agilis]